MKHIILVTALFFNFQVNAQSFEPGLWTSKESLTLNGIPLPSSNDEECISKAQAKDAKATIEKELKKKGCSLTKWVYKNQKLDASIKCDNDDMEATGKLSGPFTSKSYELKGEARGTYKQVLPAIAQLNLFGERISNCIK
ncbi:MAG: DUF3617 family protein [Bdellovibrionota bacterium]